MEGAAAAAVGGGQAEATRPEAPEQPAAALEDPASPMDGQEPAASGQQAGAAVTAAAAGPAARAHGAPLSGKAAHKRKPGRPALHQGCQVRHRGSSNCTGALGSSALRQACVPWGRRTAQPLAPSAISPMHAGKWPVPVPACRLDLTSTGLLAPDPPPQVCGTPLEGMRSFHQVRQGRAATVPAPISPAGPGRHLCAHSRQQPCCRSTQPAPCQTHQPAPCAPADLASRTQLLCRGTTSVRSI